MQYLNTVLLVCTHVNATAHQILMCVWILYIGEVMYEVMVNGSQLELVSSAVREEEGVAFEGVWMLVVYWSDVPTQGNNEVRP